LATQLRISRLSLMTQRRCGRACGISDQLAREEAYGENRYAYNQSAPTLSKQLAQFARRLTDAPFELLRSASSITCAGSASPSCFDNCTMIAIGTSCGASRAHELFGLGIEVTLTEWRRIKGIKEARQVPDAKRDRVFVRRVAHRDLRLVRGDGRMKISTLPLTR
jgi:hypothetical protein